MSNWLSKSKISLSIANNDSLLFNNRVHCFYYGCLQYMLHILHSHFKMPVEQIAQDSNPNYNGGKGSHLWLRNKVVNDLRNKTYRFDSLDRNNYLGDLKRLRIYADYGHDDIDIESLWLAKDLSSKIQTILTKRYQ